MLPSNFDLDRDALPSSTHQRKRKAQRTPSRSTSPSGHRDPHLPSQLRSLEIKLNSLQQSFSELHEDQSILINNQHAVLQVLTTMTLSPYLATHLQPFQPVTHSSNGSNSTHGSTPSSPAASDVPPMPTSASAALLPPQPSVEQALSSLPIFQHHSPPVSNPPASLVNSIGLMWLSKD